jgi:hypothetical protein
VLLLFFTEDLTDKPVNLDDRFAAVESEDKKRAEDEDEDTNEKKASGKEESTSSDTTTVPDPIEDEQQSTFKPLKYADLYNSPKVNLTAEELAELLRKAILDSYLIFEEDENLTAPGDSNEPLGGYFLCA